MGIIDQVKPDQKVSFQLNGNADGFFKDGFKFCRISSYVSYDDVSIYGTDPQVQHQRIFPLLPAGSCPNDPRKYSWLIIRTLSGGSPIAIGEPWVNMATLVLGDIKSFEVTLTGGPKSNPEAIIREALVGQGFTVQSIKTV